MQAEWRLAEWKRANQASYLQTAWPGRGGRRGRGGRGRAAPRGKGSASAAGLGAWPPGASSEVGKFRRGPLEPKWLRTPTDADVDDPDDD
eukprot:267173-Pyramimonas_sp.AAC.1